MTQQVRSFEYVPANQGDEGLVLPFQEADSQSFVEGDIVTLAAGVITLAASPTNTDIVLGIAKADATNVTSLHKYIPVQVVRPGDIFKCSFEAADTYVLANCNAAGFEIIRTSAGNPEVDQGDTGVPMCKVLGSGEFSDGVLAATAGGPIYVKFVTATHVMGT